MKRSITDFIEIKRFKNGKIALNQNLRNEGNIYRQLKELGFCRTKINDKSLLYRRVGNEIVPVKKYHLNDAFKDYLKETDFEDLPVELTTNDIINWFYEKDPIKKNGLFYQILKDQLNAEELHQVKMKTDISYKQTFLNNEMLEKLKMWNFKRTIDEKSTICSGRPLYYKNIGNEEFLIFSHYNHENVSISGFDLWRATFSSEKSIGKKKPKKLYDISLSFNLDKDFKLIKEYV
jgi:hypothetical protein